MTNKQKGEIAFDADGVTYTVRYSVDAICALEGATGKGIVALINDLLNPETMSLTLARKVLWAGLQEHHPDLSEKQAGELIAAAGGLMKVAALFNDAFAAAFPEAAAVKANPRKAGSQKKSGTGPHSTASGQA